jgi:hypothetical protein
MKTYVHSRVLCLVTVKWLSYVARLAFQCEWCACLGTVDAVVTLVSKRCNIPMLTLLRWISRLASSVHLFLWLREHACSVLSADIYLVELKIVY